MGSASGQSSGRSDWPRGRWQAPSLRRGVRAPIRPHCNSGCAAASAPEKGDSAAAKLENGTRQKSTKIVHFQAASAQLRAGHWGSASVRAGRLLTEVARSAGSPDHGAAGARFQTTHQHPAGRSSCRAGVVTITGSLTTRGAAPRPALACVEVDLFDGLSGALPVFHFLVTAIQAQLAFQPTREGISPWRNHAALSSSLGADLATGQSMRSASRRRQAAKNDERKHRPGDRRKIVVG